MFDGMGYNWEDCPQYVRDFVLDLKSNIEKMLSGKAAGFYLHGSLAMGGFNPQCSDVDMLVVTNERMDVKEKRLLAKFLLGFSKSPFPVEISFLNKEQLKHWQHPCPFDFHYSEFWREQYLDDLICNTYTCLNNSSSTDTDLAAHITILNHRGIRLGGDSIVDTFPQVPKADYLSSIMGDYQDCLGNIKVEPVYCLLNFMRVFWYLEEGVISSKKEAGNWGLNILPEDIRETLEKAMSIYGNEKEKRLFDQDELSAFKRYIIGKVEYLSEASGKS